MIMLNASLIRWTHSILGSRHIVASLGEEETIKATTAKGCHQAKLVKYLNVMMHQKLKQPH